MVEGLLACQKSGIVAAPLNTWAKPKELAATVEQALRDQSVVLPLWRPLVVLAGRNVEGLAANAWSLGPFWGAERWKLATKG